MSELDARPGRIRRTRGVATRIRRAGGAPRKILYVSHVSALGGAEHSLLDLLHGLDRQRFAPRVVLPARGGLSRQLEEAGIPFECCALLHRLHRTRRPGQAFAQAGWLLRGGLALHRLIRRHRPHLLAAAVCGLLADPPLCEKLGAAGEERAVALYDRSLMARRVEAVYDLLISGGSAKVGATA